MNFSRRRLLTGFAAVVAAAPAQACGFDGALDAGFGYVHPRAIEVALAVRQAVGDGSLDADALSPLAPGAEGLWRATEQLRLFAQAISRAAAPERPTLVLLLAEAALWTRYAPMGRVYACHVHASGPEPADVVVVTDRAVLAAVNAGRLACADALARSLMIVDGTQEAAATRLLAAVQPVASDAFAARAAFGRPR